MLIGTGTFLIWLFNLSLRPIALVDALFTATSAVCVTGLVVVDTGDFLTVPSQVVVLLLIQLGGLGVMTASTALPLLLGQKIDLRRRLLFAGGLGLDTPSGAVRLLLQILKMTLLCESVGALWLFFGFIRETTLLRALYLAVFHSVSAFCNAGFSLFPSNLHGYSQAVVIPLTIMVLIVAGGLGSPVLIELYHRLRYGGGLSSYCKLVLVMTASLVAGGSLLLLLTEWQGAFGDLPVRWKFWNALFHSITPRTAGFDTISLSRFSSSGVALTVLLMLIGASPASTGGGMKTTTVGLILVSTWTDLRGKGEVVLWGRRVPHWTLTRATSLFSLYLGTLFLSSFLLALMEPFSFGLLFFEAVSALGTVGLSLGVTGELGTLAKLVLVLLMFWGRVGLMTFLYGLLLEGPGGGKVSYADTHIPVG